MYVFVKQIILVACTLVAVAVAAPVDESEQTLQEAFEQTPEGNYNFRFETAKGIVREENGEAKEVLDEENKPHTVIVVRGSYAYVDPEGHLETIFYKADENGYEAKGDSIPQVPTRK